MVWAPYGRRYRCPGLRLITVMKNATRPEEQLERAGLGDRHPHALTPLFQCDFRISYNKKTLNTLYVRLYRRGEGVGLCIYSFIYLLREA